MDPDTVLVRDCCDFIVTDKAHALAEAAGKSLFPEIAPDEIRQYKKISSITARKLYR
ncbi:hypothetical protein M5E89_04410 [Acidaminococcus intestini]|nr:hypothetical protein M5E89_04410 [Acidaminococcus intestini]